MAAHGEINYRLFRVSGWECWIFSTRSGVSQTRERLTLGVEFFPYAFVEFRPQYRLNMESPSVGNDQALVQMHLWF
jgi:hypothetical protein